MGDIALINLPKEVLNYGGLVGNAILALNKNVRAVYAVGTTVGDFRVRELTHIAGEERTSTIHKEYGIKIYVDLKNAYFNPSLSEERRRVASRVVDGELVLDLFAGVGPFTLHIICTKNAYVLANDLNHYATQCLRKSLELNMKVVKGVVDVVNSDALELLNSIRGELFDKAILNLPHKSTYYLGKTLNILKKGGIAYTYVIAETKSEALNKVLNTVKNYEVGGTLKVLDYAPRKYIFRVEIIKK
ncbi:MAG: RsmD family RNA methyltransferase [Sulfolobales archaeon]